ncbi:hypothetical protein PF010_g20553 [Phytophthora fragariae]|uniref:Uncharacterized protein n=1 Tax=Phytophthora fragariae TaxID=53985 RepID=A0A6A3E1J5_9STRA|nr:hypothetical protein PF003_g5781 [Phytophthora fragariae]KAE8927762.1 hypothetical protein PF009_g22078 [Phytophthora fragariae]KAE9085189.1 hypothetical protein PF010_g20553 [Phytophthora fragariae]KAE9085286.1 hypothetical protein PF007_g21201 [Phytophthora fragariae]KAE9114714.1 hypothetical protein PF006_g19446 [Phytophthora fragariae]
MGLDARGAAHAFHVEHGARMAGRVAHVQRQTQLLLLLLRLLPLRLQLDGRGLGGVERAGLEACGE